MSQDDLTEIFAPRAVLPASVPQRVGYAPAPIPAPPPTPQAILTRGIVQETPTQRVRAYAGLAGTLLVLVLLTYAVAAIPVPSIPTPTAYVPYTSTAAAVVCAEPVGWTARENASFVSFTDRKARIELEAPPQSDDGSYAPLNQLHAQAQDALAQPLANTGYQEQGARTLQTGMGVALVSEWTAAPSLSRLHGYRATLLAGNNAVEVICLCEQRDWPHLQPAFVHVIQSMTPINGSQPMTTQNGE